MVISIFHRGRVVRESNELHANRVFMKSSNWMLSVRGIFSFVPIYWMKIRREEKKTTAPQQYNLKFMNRRYTVRIVFEVTGNEVHCNAKIKVGRWRLFFFVSNSNSISVGGGGGVHGVAIDRHVQFQCVHSGPFSQYLVQYTLYVIGRWRCCITIASFPHSQTRTKTLVRSFHMRIYTGWRTHSTNIQLYTCMRWAAVASIGRPKKNIYTNCQSKANLR